MFPVVPLPVLMGCYLPFVIFLLHETRSSILLRRRAKRLRKERGLDDGGRYTARSEVEKVAFWVMMRSSLFRPIRACLPWTAI